MCLGAALQWQVNRIVYAMSAPSDGCLTILSALRARSAQREGEGAWWDLRAGDPFPQEIHGQVMAEEAVSLMEEFVAHHPHHFACTYARSLLPR
jgi:tRNA(Arg) A34 adenosine deaminase TadA